MRTNMQTLLAAVIHRPVVLLIFARHYPFPPRSVFSIPGNCPVNPIRELHPGEPAHFTLELSCINGVASVVTGSIPDKRDEFLGSFQLLQNQPDSIDICPLV